MQIKKESSLCELFFSDTEEKQHNDKKLLSSVAALSSSKDKFQEVRESALGVCKSNAELIKMVFDLIDQIFVSTTGFKKSVDVLSDLRSISKESEYSVLTQFQYIDGMIDDMEASKDILNYDPMLLTEIEGNIENLVQSVTKMTEDSKMFSRFSAQIELLTNNIRGVASRTNLLALNASIEAARSGSKGRGF